MSEQDMEVVSDATEITLENAKTFLPRLPLSKTKKIAKMDSEYLLTANAAMVATTFATELFVQSLVENALAMNQLNHNNRNSKKDQNKKNARLTYNDIADSVQRLECFQFLEDVIPKGQSQQKTKNKDVQGRNTTNTSANVDETEGESNNSDESMKKDEEMEADVEEDVEEDANTEKKDVRNTTAEIKERNAINKQHTLSFFQKYQYSANNKSKKSVSNNKSNSSDHSDKNDSDAEMIDADDSNSNEDEIVEEINDDNEEEADEEDTNEEDDKLQEQLSQVEQMDHVVDVDADQTTAQPSKERMTLNRNQEDNNDLLGSSDSDSETDILRNVV